MRAARLAIAMSMVLGCASARAATITGHVRIAGSIPKPPTITMTADPTCDHLFPHGRPAENIVAGADGSLANVFVYVKSGFPKKFVFPAGPAGEARLDQKGCAFVPHAIGVRVGQEISIHSSDETLHNVDARGALNAPFNEAMVGAGSTLVKAFQHPEVAVKLKCDIHPWMTAYVGVFDHPFFAVTGPDGTFTISGLPESDGYTVEAWHESLGTRTTKIAVDDDKKSYTADFSFVGN